MAWWTPEVLILNTVSASAWVMLANSLINTYYVPIGSLKWEQNLASHSPSVGKKSDGEQQRKGSEEEMSTTDPDGQSNLPHGISSFRNPIFPTWLTQFRSSWIRLTLLASPNKAVVVSPLIFQLLCLNWSTCLQLAVNGQKEKWWWSELKFMKWWVRDGRRMFYSTTKSCFIETSISYPSNALYDCVLYSFSKCSI